MNKLFVLAIAFSCFVLLAAAQEGTSSDGQDPNSCVVNCLVDPCSNPRPDGCPAEAVCKASYSCKSPCTAHYFDPISGEETCNDCPKEYCGPIPEKGSYFCPDNRTTAGFTGRCLRDARGCHWEYTQCPLNCGALCDIYCPYGNKMDETGCPKCECNEAPNPCVNINCPAIDCPVDQREDLPFGQCCPKCATNCDLVFCPPKPTCESGSELYIPEGSCCPICGPSYDCTRVDCPLVTKCPVGMTIVKKDCCAVCVPQMDCTVVKCAGVTCPEGSKAIVLPGTCCPVCSDLPDCFNVRCPLDLTCPAGQRLVRKDLSCCPVCEPVDICTTVRCAKPECAPETWVKRQGECCPQCPYCKDSDRTKCDLNDDPVCTPGYYRGENCSDAVPPTDRVTVDITIKVCREGCSLFDGSVIERIIAGISNVSLEYIHAEVLESEDGCCRFRITIANVKGDGSLDPVNAKGTVAQAISNDPTIQVENGSQQTQTQEEMPSTGAKVVLSAAALMGASALLF